MATPVPSLRPLSCWKTLIRHSRQQKAAQRTLSTYRQPKAIGPPVDVLAGGISASRTIRKIKVYPPPPSLTKLYPEPVKEITATQLALLDPSGSRTNLFSKTNPDAAKPGDILLVRLKTGDPFSGVCINIRRRGVDTAILLRNALTRVGVEMWYKVYSPNVEGIEVVKRKERRARRARLTYYRKEEHDLGSVARIVEQYQKTRGGNSGGGGGKRGKKGKR